MTIMVTGGAGYIGSHMAHALVDRGEKILIVDDLSTGFEFTMPPTATFLEADIGDPAEMSRAISEHDVRAIVHFAGSIVVADSMVQPLAYFDNNTSKSRTLIETAVRGGVKAFLFSSSAAVYGEPETEMISESAPLRPVSPYGWSKLMTEIMLRAAADAHGLRYGALRYFNVAGADPAGRTGESTAHPTHLIHIATQAALGTRSRLDIFGTDYPTPDGTCVRDYVHVSDLIAAHVLVLDSLLGGGENLVLNCGYGHGFSVLEVIEAVKRVSGVDFEARPAPRRAGDPSTLVADTAVLRQRLGWTPRFDDLDAIVGHALAWEASLAERGGTGHAQPEIAAGR
jgi:UDP-glucose 4-epimerase